MSIYRVLTLFKKTHYLVAALAALLLLAGCSSSMSNVKTWEGDADSSQAATLEAPGEIQVQQVNGRTLGNFLMDDLALNYDLLPGDNQVVFTYKTIWAKSEVVRNGESKVHVVETAPQTVTIEARPGETYSFSFEAPGSRNEAEAFASDFSTDIVNASGEVVASSTPWDGRSSEPSRAHRSPVSKAKSDDSGSPENGDEPLAELKALWGEASEEERREFLRWAFE